MSDEWTKGAIEDLFTDAIGDSFDMDWQARDGARAIMRELDKAGLHVVPALTHTRLAETHRRLAEKEPVAAAHLRFAESHEQVKKFKIRINREEFMVGERISGAALRALPDKPIGDDRDLFHVIPGGSDTKVELDDVIELRDHMRFFTAPAVINPGVVVAA